MIGSPSMFVKRLTARTSNSCSSPDSGSPAVSGPAVNGELHGVHPDPSTEHWNVTPSAAVWSDENVNTPLALVVSAGGIESIRVCGSPSTVQLRTAGLGSTFGGSARSNDRTRSVCEPVARPVSSYRPSQPSYGPSSSEHSNSASISVLRKLNITSGPVTEPSAGPKKISVSGGVVSTGAFTSHPYMSRVGSTLPSGSRARTYITCGPPLTPVIVYGWSEQSTKSASSSAHSNSKTGSPVASSSPL